jgi:hypothetical protein
MDWNFENLEAMIPRYEVPGLMVLLAAIGLVAVVVGVLALIRSRRKDKV